MDDDGAGEWAWGLPHQFVGEIEIVSSLSVVRLIQVDGAFDPRRKWVNAVCNLFSLCFSYVVIVDEKVLDFQKNE